MKYEIKKPLFFSLWSDYGGYAESARGKGF